MSSAARQRASPTAAMSIRRIQTGRDASMTARILEKGISASYLTRKSVCTDRNGAETVSARCCIPKRSCAAFDLASSWAMTTRDWNCPLDGWCPTPLPSMPGASPRREKSCLILCGRKSQARARCIFICWKTTASSRSRMPATLSERSCFWRRSASMRARTATSAPEMY